MNAKRWTLLIVANIVILGVLSFYRATDASQPGRQPFANSVEQRGMMIQELRQIRQLLDEQNKLLREVVRKDREQQKRR